MALIRSVDLWCKEGSSDKVYFMQITQKGMGSDFSLAFQYGRRGSTMNKGFKVQDGPLYKCEKEFESLLKQKLGKGYRITDRFDGGLPEAHTPKEDTPKEEAPAPVAPAPAVISRDVYGTVTNIVWG